MAFSLMFEAMDDLRRFVEVSRLGLSLAPSAERLEMASAGSLEGRDPIAGRPSITGDHLKFRAFAERQISGGFPFLYSIATAHLWSILEMFVREYALSSIEKSEKVREQKAVQGIRGPLVKFLLFNDEQRAQFLYREIEQAAKAPLSHGVGRFEGVLNVLGLGGSVARPVKNAIFEIANVRNAVVHNAARVDSTLIENCSWLDWKVGDPISIEPSRYDCYHLSVQWYSLEISRRYYSLETPDVLETDEDLRDQVALQGEILNRLETAKRKIPSSAD